MSTRKINRSISEFRNNYAHSYAISHWDPGLSGIVARKINVMYPMLLAIVMQSHIITREFVVFVIQTHLSIYTILSLSVHISMFIRLAEVCNGPYTVLNLLEYHARYPRIKYSCVYNVYIPSELGNRQCGAMSCGWIHSSALVEGAKSRGLHSHEHQNEVLFQSTAFFPRQRNRKYKDYGYGKY